MYANLGAATEVEIPVQQCSTFLHQMQNSLHPGFFDPRILKKEIGAVVKMNRDKTRQKMLLPRCSCTTVYEGGKAVAAVQGSSSFGSAVHMQNGAALEKALNLHYVIYKCLPNYQRHNQYVAGNLSVVNKV